MWFLSSWPPRDRYELLCRQEGGSQTRHSLGLPWERGPELECLLSVWLSSP